MAKSIIASQNGAPVPTIGDTPPLSGITREQVYQIDSATAAAIGLVDLLIWLNKSRDFRDAVNFWKEHDPTLAAALKSHDGIPRIGETEWNEEESFGLDRLCMAIRGELHDTRRFAGLPESPL
ncbi:MAG: hypothetical protein ABIR54_07150 [Burkholderiaceae bacterium]